MYPTRNRHAAAKTMERVAKGNGAYLVEVRLPGEGYRRWFAARNLGEPFDRKRSLAVHEELRALGVLDEDNKLNARHRHGARR